MNIEIFSHMPEADLNHITDMISRNNLNIFDRLGSGSYGEVYGYKGFAIKMLDESEFCDDGENNDVEVLQNLAHLDCVPKLYAVVDKSIMIVERIRGLTIRDITEQGKEMDTINLDERFEEKFDLSLKAIIDSGYSPNDLHESNVMIEEITNNPKIVDVGWFKRHHWTKGNYSDVDEIVGSIDGYSRAHRWTGNAVSRYVKQKRRQALAN